MKICKTRNPAIPSCGRLLDDEDFYTNQSLCKRCYNKATYQRKLGRFPKMPQGDSPTTQNSKNHRLREAEEAQLFNSIITRPL